MAIHQRRRGAARIAAAAGIVLLAGGTMGHAAAKERVYPVAKMGRLLLPVPATWAEEVERHGGESPLEIAYTPPGGGGFVRVSVLWNASAPEIDVPATAVTGDLIRLRAEALTRAVEQEAPFQELTGENGSGLYFSVTDREPKPDEFELMTQVMFTLGRVVLGATVLTHEASSPLVEEVLAALRGARFVPADGAGR